MRDPISGNVLGNDEASQGKQKLVGFLVAFLFIAILLGYLISIA